jgi:hypothetical protein
MLAHAVASRYLLFSAKFTPDRAWNKGELLVHVS